jgi:TolB protein
MTVDGSSQKNLTGDPADDRNAAWSPDGTEIAFASDRGGQFQLYAMRRDGSRLTRLTHDDARATIPDWQRFPGGQPPPRCRHPQRAEEGDG